MVFTESLQNVYFLHFFDISSRLRVVRSKSTQVLQLRINWEIILYQFTQILEYLI